MNKRDLTFWAKVAAFFIAYTLLMSWMQEKDAEAAKVEAYSNGIAEGIAIEDKVNQQRGTQKALDWWVGSSDIKEVRDRLCRNYYKPKVK